MWFNILIAIGLLTVIVAMWFGVHYWLNPHLEDPDGEASITGACGDTMEIRLRFSRNRVVETSHFTSGCLYSLNCVCAAADLAKGKTLEEVIDIDADTIQKSIGGLPSDHMHCARLAVATLQGAVDDYMSKSIGKPSISSHDHRFNKRHSSS